jgi:Mor family transcriptional regulator
MTYLTEKQTLVTEHNNTVPAFKLRTNDIVYFNNRYYYVKGHKVDSDKLIVDIILNYAGEEITYLCSYTQMFYVPVFKIVNKMNQ